MTRLGFLGFGEVARRFAEGMVRTADASIVAYDRVVETDGAAALRELASSLDVGLLDTPAGLAEVDLVLSVVTPAAAAAAAASYAAHARAGQIYVDLNSTAPEVKHEVEAILAPHGLRVVDGVMTGGGISLDGHRIPISLAGPDAEEVAAHLDGLGLVTEVVGAELGQAAAMKMLRGVVIKGLEALSVEAFVAARAYGIEDLVLGSIGESLDRWSAADFLQMLVRTHTEHCTRRAVEVRMIKETVAGAGLDPVMSAAAQQLFERSAAHDLRDDGALPDDFEASVRVLSRALLDPDDHPPTADDGQEPPA
jgi:3-hydroxyisobutyrate dehydrogenase-like beta-hydroxyacid dehydrogenase